MFLLQNIQTHSTKVIQERLKLKLKVQLTKDPPEINPGVKLCDWTTEHGRYFPAWMEEFPLRRFCCWFCFKACKDCWWHQRGTGWWNYLAIIWVDKIIQCGWHRTELLQGRALVVRKQTAFQWLFFIKAGLYCLGRVFPELPRDFKKLFKVSLLSRNSGLPIIEKSFL